MRTLTAALLLAAGIGTVTVQDTDKKKPMASDETLEAIRATALDYAEGWYTADADRMERAVHPELAKRIAMTSSVGGHTKLKSMTADTLISTTRVGTGRWMKAGEDTRERTVEVLDVDGPAATVKVTMEEWFDYMHLAEVDGQWRIINVLWDFKPDRKAAMRLK